MLMHKAVRSSRYFVNRVLQGLGQANSGRIVVTDEKKWDLKWISEFVPKFNGTTTYKHTILEQHTTLEIDACLNKVGGVWMHYVYSAEIPKDIKDRGSIHNSFRNAKYFGSIESMGQKMDRSTSHN